MSLAMWLALGGDASLVVGVIIVRLVTRGLYRTVAKVASVSGYSVSKCGASFVCM